MASNKSHEIVLLGGNFGGLGAAHYLLRHVIPALEQLDKTRVFHITLVTPNTQLFFKPASPRASIQPNLLAESKLWRPLSDAFKQYPASHFKLVQASATGIDPSARSVTVASTGAEAQEQTIAYDSLIISTGTTSPSALWTLHRDEKLTSEAFKAVQASLPKSKTILIAGGGPVGVETAGEIASAHHQAKITLLSGGSRLLPHFKHDTSTKAQSYLEQKLGVTVVHNVRVERSFNERSKLESAQVPLTDGSTHTADMYIDATGGAPNSQFLPKDWLDETGRLITKDAYFRVRGSENKDATASGIYALGDIVAGSKNTIFELDAMVPTVCSSIGVDIAAQYQLVVKAEKPGFLRSLLAVLPGMGAGSTGVLKQKEFKPMKDTVLVPIGTQGGVGQLFGWQAPSWLVKMAKGKSYLIEMIDPMISGEKWKAS
ncbi:hypothetical protein N0V82_006436 [Gnomoniopsis sp. IMI 355080]|nr:hypothetical protein N0V82_006436 [Gnomoniopsis sp. IMI 355080]